MKFTFYFRERHDLSNKPPVCVALSTFVTSTLPRDMYVSKRSMFLICFVAYCIFFLSYELREEKKVTVVLVLYVNSMKALIQSNLEE